MAWLNSLSQGQLRAIVLLRARLLINSLRSVRHRLNLVSRGFATLLVLAAGLGGGFSLGLVAWGITKTSDLQWLALAFWLVFLFWQCFPLMASAFNESFDISSLLRFPLSYRTYFLVRLIYGALDIATALGICWSLGLLIGISVAEPRLAAWALVAVVVFIGFNILLARMIFVWIEHWLSRRRSREVMSVFFLLILIGVQVAGPVLGRYSKQAAPQRLHLLAQLLPLGRALPPGLVEATLSRAAQGRPLSALISLALFAAYGTGVLTILNLRMRDQYRGENPSGGAKPKIRERGVIRPGWKLPGLSGPVSAVFEKELHYFLRSGPMLFTLIMPLVMVFILWGGRRALLSQQLHQPGFVFPVGAAYCLLVMTNIVYNSFGGDGGGIQFFLVSPVRFRQIAVGKNLAQLTLLAADVFILWLGVRTIYEPPALEFVALTFAWFLFAVPLSFSFGNLLSIYFPKRIDYSTFGRQRAAESTILASLAVQLGSIAIGALCVLIAHVYSELWIATLTLLGLSVFTITGYFLLLNRLDRIVMDRREVLATELCRA